MSPSRTPPRKVLSNRRNAQKSTGPKTPQGKERSSQNALKHGLHSSAILVLGEDPETHESFRQGLFASLIPVGALETMIADRVVLYAWRLERARRVERETYVFSLEESRYDASGELSELLNLNHSLPRPRPEDETPTQAAFHWQGGAKLERLLRHECQLERTLFRLLRELESLQAKRRKQAGDPASDSNLARDGFVSPNSDHDAELGDMTSG